MLMRSDRQTRSQRAGDGKLVRALLSYALAFFFWDCCFFSLSSSCMPRINLLSKSDPADIMVVIVFAGEVQGWCAQLGLQRNKI